MLGPDFAAHEFVLSQEAYPFSYISTGCAQSTRGTTTAVPGSPCVCCKAYKGVGWC